MCVAKVEATAGGHEMVAALPCQPEAMACVDLEDWQAQLDEVLALASIFGEDFRLLAPDHASCANGMEDTVEQLRQQPPHAAGVGLLHCEVLCHLNLPAGGLQLLVSTGVAASGTESGMRSQAGASDIVSVPFGQPVRYLPPVVLKATLTTGYPSCMAPTYSVHASWLSDAQAASLAAQLGALWHEQGLGLPVLYTWATWLQEAALSHLASNTKFTLYDNSRDHPLASGSAVATPPAQEASPCTQCNTHSCLCSAAAGGGQSAEQVALALLRYNATQEADVFAKSRWTCGICFEDVQGSACMRLQECGHYYCSDCFRRHCRTQLDELGRVELHCPEPSCRRVLSPQTVHESLDQDSFVRWEERLLQRTLDKMQDIVYCPRCQCPCIEEDQHLAQCPKCLYTFCSLCTDSWHPGVECMNLEQRTLALEQRRTRAGRAESQRDAQRTLDLLNQMRSLKLVAETSKPCPGCAMATSKTEGCNKMTCTYCHAYWCWRCSEMLIGRDPYAHFRGGGSCVLFEQEEIERWNRMAPYWGAGAGAAAWAPADRVAPLRAPGPLLLAARCPVCGQVNHKMGQNNLIRCFSCTSHFCYLCRMWLRAKVGTHFTGSAARCKQHTRD